MIYVERPETLAPAAWVTRATAEREQVITAFAAFEKAAKAAKARAAKAANTGAAKATAAKKKKKKDPEFTFTFAAYGDDLLREALNKAYGYKCAYCETFYGASQPVAVEHYRPKGAFVEGKVRVKPGYYWLAAAWSNLLPSCTDCNSPRRQEMEAGKKVVRGKGNFFPLEPGSKRAKSPGDEANEKPLLLHPEIDHPEEHLEFLTAQDRLGVIRPALIGGQPSAKAVASIDVYALDRPQLVLARSTHAARLRAHIRNTQRSESRYRSQPNDAGLKAEYEENLAELLSLFLSDSNVYAGMARQIARAELPGLQL